MDKHFNAGSKLLCDKTSDKETCMKTEPAAQNFRQGYNCAQSVCLAFLDVLKLDRETVLKLSSSFGGGMGRLREVCGAVSAMFIIAGILKGYKNPNDDTVKGAHYALIQRLAEEFKKQHNSIICRELLGLDGKTEGSPENVAENASENGCKINGDDFSPKPSKRTEEYYAKRPCESFIRTAAEIIEKHLLQ